MVSNVLCPCYAWPKSIWNLYAGQNQSLNEERSILINSDDVIVKNHSFACQARIANTNNVWSKTNTAKGLANCPKYPLLYDPVVGVIIYHIQNN